MGILDKLKNAGKSVLIASSDAIAKYGQAVNNGASSTLKSEEAAIVAAQEKAERIAKALEPTCEKGDCLWNNSYFYFTCPAECECERKKFTKKNWGGKIKDERLWKYMKRLEKLEEPASKKEIYEDFMAEFLPQYGNGMWGIAKVVFEYGFESERNPLIDILFAITEMPQIENIVSKLQFLRSECMRKTLSHNIFKNQSLYNRSMEDFEYTVKIFNTVLDEEKLSSYFVDTSVASVEQLFDENGNVKPAGLGGPQAGFYGDTIYNTVESWAGENGENDIQY